MRRRLEDFGIRRRLEDFGIRKRQEDFGIQRRLEDFVIRRRLEDFGIRRRLEDFGIRRRLRYQKVEDFVFFKPNRTKTASNFTMMLTVLVLVQLLMLASLRLISHVSFN